MGNIIKLAKIVKLLSLIDFDTKNIYVINNTNMDIAKNLELTNVKKYWRYKARLIKKVKDYIEIGF